MTSVADIAAISSVAGQCAELTTLQVAAGYLTWLNVAKVFAVVLGGVCFAFLFGRFVLNLLLIFALIPPVLYEILGFALSAGLLAAPALLGVSGPDATWFVTPGGILFAATIILSAKMRSLPPNNARFFGLLTLVWGGVAVWYGNQVAGFGAVAAFMAFTGFSIIVMPLSYAIGFEDEKATNRAGGAGLLICLILIFERWSGASIPQLDVFRAGMEWLGPFVFALAILINSSLWTLDQRKQSYLGMQVMAVAAYSAMIVAGGSFHIDALLNVGTGMLILWLIEKPFEIAPKNLTALSATGLVVALAVGGGVYWAQHNIDIVSHWMPALAAR
jgi:hypothetical protein